MEGAGGHGQQPGAKVGGLGFHETIESAPNLGRTTADTTVKVVVVGHRQNRDIGDRGGRF